MRAGIDAACREGVVAITAGNYGGKLGPHHFHLRQDHGGDRVSDGLVAAPARRRSAAAPTSARCFAASWGALTRGGAGAPAGASPKAERPRPLGDLFDVARQRRQGPIRFQGDLRRADRLGAGLAEGAGRRGRQCRATRRDSACRAACSTCTATRAPARAARRREARRGMTGGELVVRGNAGHASRGPHASRAARRHGRRRPARGRGRA